MRLACAPVPFRIDVIAHGRGAIGVAACPGGGATTLAQDLAAITAFRPDAIVTLLSAHELKTLGRSDLPDLLPGLAPQWHHTPLRASGAPDARFERLWTYTGHRLRALLRRGGMVLIHCDEGSARARWAAARLLTELGVSPGEAAAKARLRPLATPPPVTPRARSSRSCCTAFPSAHSRGASSCRSSRRVATASGLRISAGMATARCRAA